MARSRSIGSIYAELTLKDTSFRKKLNEAGKAAAAFGKKSAVVGTAALSAGIIAGSAALLTGTRRTLEMTDSLGDMAAQTGVAVADMMKLQRAYDDGGRAASMAGADIAKMQKNLVTAAAGGNDPFSALGLSAKELLALDPADQFNRIGAAIMRIENPAERTAKAMEIFGKGGRGLLTVFEGIPAAERALGRMPELAQKFAGAMGEANDLIGHLPLKSDQFFMGFTAGIIGELLPGLKKIDEYDFTTLGESLGNTIATAFQGLTDGSIWEIFRLTGEKAIAGLGHSPAFNSFVSSFEAIGGALSGESFADAFTKAYEENEWFSTKAADDIDKQISAIWDKLEKRHDSARAAVTDLPTPPAAPQRFAPSLPEPVNPADIRTPAAASDIGFVNDYQRRGLSLSGSASNGTENKLQEQTNVMREMKMMLSRVVEKFEPGTW